MRSTDKVGDEAEVGIRLAGSLRDIRKLSKMTQADVARQLGVVRAHISAMECGRVKQVPLSTFVAWGRILGIELNITFDPRRS